MQKTLYFFFTLRNFVTKKSLGLDTETPTCIYVKRTGILAKPFPKKVNFSAQMSKFSDIILWNKDAIQWSSRLMITVYIFIPAQISCFLVYVTVLIIITLFQ